MSEEVRPMVCQNAVMGSDALPRRRCCCSGRHTSSECIEFTLPCARLRPKVTGRTQELSLLHSARDHRGD
jgi:hypothetical protein